MLGKVVGLLAKMSKLINTCGLVNKKIINIDLTASRRAIPIYIY